MRISQNCLGICISALALLLMAEVPAVADTTLTNSSQTGITAAPPPPPPLLPPQPDRITGEYVTGYLTDTGRILLSPAQWDRSDWMKAGLVVGITSGILFVDADIRNVSQRNQSSTADKAASAGNALGNPFYTVPSLGLFYLYGHLNQDPKARQTSLLAVESVAISGVAAFSIKAATQRPRPSAGKTSLTWDGPGFNNIDTSFPSIHTQTAFSIASVIAEEYSNIPFTAPLAYGLATLTGISRIYDNKHWASDVVFGGAIGYFVGKAVVGYHRNKSNSPVTILPAISQQGYGLVASYRF